LLKQFRELHLFMEKCKLVYVTSRTVSRKLQYSVMSSNVISSEEVN